MEDIYADFAGAVVSKVLDVYTGHGQVRMLEVCKEMTTVTCNYGNYKFEMIAFRLTNAVTAFQRVKDVVFRGLPFVMVCVDDGTIFSRSIEKHMQHCGELFERIRKAELTFRVTKCSLAQSEIKLLGHVVSPGAVQVDVERIEDILEALVPTNLAQLRSVYGLGGYVCRFIRNFAECPAVF